MCITVTNMLANARLNRHRQLFFLSHNEQALLNQLCGDNNSQYNTSLSKQRDINASSPTALPATYLPNATKNADVSDQINALLGTENSLIIYDVSKGFHASVFAAAAGTLVAGGTMVVLHDSCASTKATASNTIQKLHSTRRKTAKQSSLFLKRINDSIRLACVAVNGYTNALALQQNHNAQTSTTNYLLTQASHQPEPWLLEQNKHLDQLTQLLAQDNKTTIVVQADRGRGKSALLGKAIAQSKKRVSLTANRKESTAVLRRFAREDNTSMASNTEPEFIPVHEALLQRHELLLVEEAGALPVPVLLQLQRQSKQIIFATTVQGYEGAGRGFAIRFAKLLDEHAPNWVRICPALPIRWATNDPLENFINKLLLLNAQLPTVPSHGIDAQTSVVKLVEKTELANNETLLEQIYGLLVQAHYQTTPADLRNLLDQEALLVFAQYNMHQLTGAALVAIEGNIDAQLAQAVLSKKRRLHNQLLPQLLAQSANNTDALGASYGRIVRIAIHPELHRQGLGTALINGIKMQLKARVEAIGTSFGADTETLGFWQKQGLQAFHYGLRQNPRSGLRATAMLSTTDPVVQPVLNHALCLFQNNIAYRSASNTNTNTNTNTNSVLSLLMNPAHEKVTRCMDNSMELVGRFINGERAFVDTIAALHKVAKDLNDASFSAKLNTLTALCAEEALISPKQLRRLENETREHLAKLNQNSI